MQLSEHEIIEKCAKHCGRCGRNTLLPYEKEWIFISCGFNLIKTKQALSKIQRLKCVDVYKIYEDNNSDKIYEDISTLRKTKN